MSEPTQISTYFKEAMTENRNLTEKQKQILEASLSLFAEKGFANTTTADIAQRAGVAEGTVYKRYANKQELLRAIIQPFLAVVLPRMATEFGAERVNLPFNTLRDFLTSVVTDRMHFVMANISVIKVLFEALMYNVELRNKFKDVATKAIGQIFTPAVTRLKEQHLVADIPNDMVYQLVISTFLGAVYREFLDLSPRDANEQIAFIIDTLDKGLRP